MISKRIRLCIIQKQNSFPYWTCFRQTFVSNENNTIRFINYKFVYQSRCRNSKLYFDFKFNNPFATISTLHSSETLALFPRPYQISPHRLSQEIQRVEHRGFATAVRADEYREGREVAELHVAQSAVVFDTQVGEAGHGGRLSAGGHKQAGFAQSNAVCARQCFACFRFTLIRPTGHWFYMLRGYFRSHGMGTRLSVPARSRPMLARWV